MHVCDDDQKSTVVSDIGRPNGHAADELFRNPGNNHVIVPLKNAPDFAHSPLEAP
jgi:hypothetical protein